MVRCAGVHLGLCGVGVVACGVCDNVECVERLMLVKLMWRALCALCVRVYDRVRDVFGLKVEVKMPGEARALEPIACPRSRESGVRRGERGCGRVEKSVQRGRAARRARGVKEKKALVSSALAIQHGKPKPRAWHLIYARRSKEARYHATTVAGW